MKRRDLFKGIALAGVLAAKPLSAVLLPPEDEFTALPIGGHSVKVYVPKPFLFLNIAGQTGFPLYASNGFPACKAVAYLFPNENEIKKIDGLAMAPPPDTGYNLCAHNGACYAAIALPNVVERPWDEEIIARHMNLIVSQAVESLKKFHVNTPAGGNWGRLQTVHTWHKTVKESI